MLFRSNVLVDEYTALRAATDAPTIANSRNWVILGIQMLLGTVRRIIETPVMDPNQIKAQYPDPMLLQGRTCDLFLTLCPRSLKYTRSLGRKNL